MSAFLPSEQDGLLAIYKFYKKDKRDAVGLLYVRTYFAETLY